MPNSQRPEKIDLGDDFPFNIRVDPKLIIGGLVVLLVIIWFAFGGPAYTVAPDEEGVVLTFGQYAKTTPPGLHFKWPWPIQTVEKPKVAEVKRLEFGFRSIERGGMTSYRDFSDDSMLLDEAQMLTGDENVVNVSMAIQYQISNSIDYLFNFRSPSQVVDVLRDIGEATLRQEVGDRPIDHVLTSRKFEIQANIKERMQELVKEYGVGVSVTAVQLQDVKPPKEVESAFQEVASAREEQQQIINVARGYREEQIPKAEGEAQNMVLKAQGYKEARIAEAKGEVARFVALTEQFELAPEVTRVRMYLEAMAELLPKVKVTVIDENAGVVNLKSLGGEAPPLLAGASGAEGQGTSQKGGAR